jgi:iron(II)-dependent oxidoreductase
MTLVTCLVLALIGGTIHVVMLGKLRLGDMRRMATYDLKEESARVRAAGEDIAPIARPATTTRWSTRSDW